MELMEFNLYQLLKARENKPFDPRTVQVILWQVISALQHIHANGFFHRDIKPENVLISTIPAHHHSSSRSLHTPPSTPPTTSPSTYLVKLADFGLAREIRSRPPYTTYVSTRWYRAPEVLLRAEEYGAPVDIWAVGAMAIEVATLRPMFPGSNEIDQLWKVCEVMGTPEREGRERDWHSGDDGRGRRVRIGGGAWGSAMKLAHAINFKFPNVCPSVPFRCCREIDCRFNRWI
jgi:meiosis induction protein kinase IME2/SME1